MIVPSFFTKKLIKIGRKSGVKPNDSNLFITKKAFIYRVFLLFIDFGSSYAVE